MVNTWDIPARYETAPDDFTLRQEGAFLPPCLRTAQILHQP